MHPVLVLTAFAVAAVVTYAVVLAALTATSFLAVGDPDDVFDETDDRWLDVVPAAASDGRRTRVRP